MAQKKKSPAPGVTVLDDGRYRVKVTSTDPRTGKRKYAQKILPHGTSLGEAVDAREALRESVLSSTATRPSDKLRFEDFAEDWIERNLRGRAPKTISCYELALAYAMPIIGDMFLDQIMVEDLELLRDVMAEQKTLSHASGLGYWGKIRRVVRAALLRSGYQGVDPFLVVRPPECTGGKPRTRPVLSAGEPSLLLEGASKRSLCGGKLSHLQRQYELLVLLGTGLRVGELVSIKWSDVDGDAIIIRPEIEKTRRGRRVAISQDLAQALQDWRREMIAAQHKGLASGLIFPSPSTGRRRPPSGISRAVKSAALAAGMDEERAKKLSPHALRRTYNRLALDGGADPAALRDQLGHSSAEMTRLYRGDSSPKERAQVAQIVGLGCGTSKGGEATDADTKGVQQN